MDINALGYKDRGEFLRGFSVIVRKNRCNSSNEKSMFLIIGESLGFEKEFCKEALEHLGVNKYISEEPALFTDKLIADFFMTEMSKLLFHTHSMSEAVVEWLLQTAKANEIHFVL